MRTLYTGRTQDTSGTSLRYVSELQDPSQILKQLGYIIATWLYRAIGRGVEDKGSILGRGNLFATIFSPSRTI
jgi:hypothetical protein